MQIKTYSVSWPIPDSAVRSFTGKSAENYYFEVCSDVSNKKVINNKSDLSKLSGNTQKPDHQAAPEGRQARRTEINKEHQRFRSGLTKSKETCRI